MVLFLGCCAGLRIIESAGAFGIGLWALSDDGPLGVLIASRALLFWPEVGPGTGFAGYIADAINGAAKGLPAGYFGEMGLSENEFASAAF